MSKSTSRTSEIRVGAAVLAGLLLTPPAAALQLTQVTFGVPAPSSQSEFDPAWSPDGNRLAVSGDFFSPGAFESWWFVGLVELPGGVPVEFEATVGFDHVYYNQHPVWSPDGTQIAFRGGYPSGGLWLASVATGAARLLIAELPNSLDWSPDGTKIAFAVPAGIRVVDVASGSFVPPVPQSGAQNPEWSADGSKLAYDFGGYIWVLDVATAVATQVSTGPGNHQHPTWSPDGHWIAFASGPGDGADLWVIGSAGGAAIQLTSGPAYEREPVWSPDGERIAFTVWNPNDGPHVWVASDLPTFTVPVRNASWSALKRMYR